MKARVSESPLIKELLGETTPEEMERIDKEMSKQQTAVEWLACEIGGLDTGVSYHYFAKKVEEAKEMEKENTIAFADKYDAYVVRGGTLTARKYYNETYGGNNHLCCTPIGQIKRYVNCIGCDRKPLTYGGDNE